MEEARTNTRLYAKLSLGLFITGLLVPFLLAAIGGLWLGIGFGVVSEVLALFFGILGWADKRARVAVIGVMVLFVWAGAVAVISGTVRKPDRQETRMEAEASARSQFLDQKDVFYRR